MVNWGVSNIGVYMFYSVDIVYTRKLLKNMISYLSKFFGITNQVFCMTTNYSKSLSEIKSIQHNYKNHDIRYFNTLITYS